MLILVDSPCLANLHKAAFLLSCTQVGGQSLRLCSTGTHSHMKNVNLEPCFFSCFKCSCFTLSFCVFQLWTRTLLRRVVVLPPSVGFFTHSFLYLIPFFYYHISIRTSTKKSASKGCRGSTQGSYIRVLCSWKELTPEESLIPPTLNSVQRAV